MRRFSKALLNDKMILGVIIINSIVIFIQGFEIDYQLKNFLVHTDNIITIVFILEIIAKVHAFSFKNYIKSNWNRFDFILIILATPSLYFWIFGGEHSNLDFFLILRISRVLKFFRFVRFFPNINKLIVGLHRALKASVVVLLGFLVYNFVISVLSCFIYKEIAPEYFGDPLKSFYTIFKIFTVEGWHEIPDHISENASQSVSFFTKIYFVIILMTGGIFGLSIINSIFVDAMVSDNNDELERKVESLEKKIDILINNNKNK